MLLRVHLDSKIQPKNSRFLSQSNVLSLLIVFEQHEEAAAASLAFCMFCAADEKFVTKWVAKVVSIYTSAFVR